MFTLVTLLFVHELSLLNSKIILSHFSTASQLLQELQSQPEHLNSSVLKWQKQIPFLNVQNLDGHLKTCPLSIQVVSIDFFCHHSVHFSTLECIKNIFQLSNSDVIVSQKGSNGEGSISLGRTIILLALFTQNLMFGQRYILSRSSDPASHSSVRKGHKRKPEQANGDYFPKRSGLKTTFANQYDFQTS